MISAQVICDSVSSLTGDRLTTLILTYPRFIHSEFMTHRVLSKNSASSRAIPISRMIDDIEQNPFYPIWTERKKGMQGELVTDEGIIDASNHFWDEAKRCSFEFAKLLDALKIHKQDVNRLLEPFMHMRVICSGTEWENFFALRDHGAAMPEIQELARNIRTAIEGSQPNQLKPGEWHIPFGDKMDEGILAGIAIKNAMFGFGSDGEWEEAVMNLKLKVAIGRCARISYLTHDGEIDYEADIDLYKRLVDSTPQHLSPTEHIATVPDTDQLIHLETHYKKDGLNYRQVRGKYVSNFTGWIQCRKIIENL